MSQQGLEAFATAAREELDKRPELGAGGKLASSVLPIGTAAGEVKQGDWKPAWADGIDGKPAVIAEGADAAEARGKIGAVATVNGVAPDGSGNVTVATGSVELGDVQTLIDALGGAA